MGGLGRVVQDFAQVNVNYGIRYDGSECTNNNQEPRLNFYYGQGSPGQQNRFETAKRITFLQAHQSALSPGSWKPSSPGWACL